MKRMILCLISVSSMTYCMERTYTEKNLTKSDDAQAHEFQQNSPTNTKPLSKSKSQKVPVKSHAQLAQEVRNITNKHRLMVSDSSCSTSEKKG